MRHFVTTILATIVATGVGSAADAVPAETLKKNYTEWMTKAGVKTVTFGESDAFLVAGSAAESKAKQLADTLQKVYTVAFKGLGMEDRDKSETKIAILCFADPDAYKSYFQSAAPVKRRIESNETSFADFKSDRPFLALAGRRSEPNYSFEAVAVDEVILALMQKKGLNASFPQWMKKGFIRAVQGRIDSKISTADRGIAKKVIGAPIKKGANPPTVAQIAWDANNKNSPGVGASLMDWMTFGPGLEKFGVVANNLNPGDGEPKSFEDALKAAEMKVEDIDRPWREWVHKGSPARSEKDKK